MKSITVAAFLLMILPSPGQPAGPPANRPVPPPMIPGVTDQAPKEPPYPVKLSVESRPKFSTLTAGGLRFLNPGGPGGSNSISLESGPILLTLGGAGPVEVDKITAGFRQKDLTPPGPHYPPAPPVTADTPVGTLYFNSMVPQEKLEAVLKGLMPQLGIDGKKAEIWLKNGMWDIAGMIELQGTIPDGRTRLFVASGKEGPFRVSVDISWGQPHEGQPGGQRSQRR